MPRFIQCFLKYIISVVKNQCTKAEKKLKSEKVTNCNFLKYFVTIL